MKTKLADESYINLATFRRNGHAVETPVWFAPIGKKLYIFTDGTSAKVKRIRATKTVRIAPCNVFGTVTGDWRDGSARVVSETKLIDSAYKALHDRYGIQMSLVDLVSWVFGRIGQRAILEVVLE